MTQVLTRTPARTEGSAPPASTREAGLLARLLPGLLLVGAGVVAALSLHRLVDAVGVLTWAVLLGVLAANLGLVHDTTQPGVRMAVKRLLRIGVVLLGFSLPISVVLALGAPVLTLVAVTLTTTLVLTTWLGLRLRLGRARSLLIGTGFAICGASAVAAMQRTAEADEDDVATAVAMVTVWGSLAMVAVPLLQGPLGLSTQELGVWAGASVHEVGQVVAAAGPAGAAAVSLAVAVKLTRVLLLAPVVATVSVVQRRAAGRVEDSAGSGESAGSARRPPLVPVFVLGFLACVALRSLGVVPPTALWLIEHLQTVALAAALFALGTGVRMSALRRSGGTAMLLGGLSTVTVAGLSLPLVLWLV
ncbi:MAG TPA: putative sulfate exporter family transporter [Nocardioidaceae bacterium]|nr:putative sulfate exporter family transporter [Nocardioidaceae bacterium]